MADRRRTMAEALAWRPEWPVALLVLMAWVVLLVVHTTGPGATHAAHDPDTSHRTSMTSAVDAAEPATVSPTFHTSLGLWALMCVAMMVPVSLPAVRHVGFNSFRNRRQWAMAVFLASYVAVWVVFGIVALAVVAGAKHYGATENALVIGGLAVATGWQLTPWKRRAVLACQRTVPLPPTGRRADAACVLFGAKQAGRCLIGCWPLMLIMAVVGHRGLLGLVLMVLLTAVIAAEMLTQRRRRLIRPTAIPLAVAASALLLLG